MPEPQVLPEGVKYVPYSAFIGDNKDIDFTWGEDGEYLGGDTWCELSSGVLPSGLTLNEAGEITGVPMASGSFTFTVMIGNADGASERNFDLTILSNTDAAVQKPNDYPITDPVGTPDPNDPNHFYKTGYRTEVLRIDGPYHEFMRLLIDGKEKVRGVQYDAREGSTVITIYDETFEEVGSGTHTIAAEFREGGQPDVTPADWFYDDVKWAYENEMMTGVSDTRFAPDEDISQATIVTVLARLAGVDLTPFSEVNDPTIESGKWYSTAALIHRISVFEETNV